MYEVLLFGHGLASSVVFDSENLLQIVRIHVVAELELLLVTRYVKGFLCIYSFGAFRGRGPADLAGAIYVR